MEAAASVSHADPGPQPDRVQGPLRRAPDVPNPCAWGRRAAPESEGARDDEEDESLQDWDQDSDLWENQGQTLTVHWLQVALRQCAPELPVRIELYDGTGERAELVPMELGFTGVGEKPSALVLTVHPAKR